MFLNSSSFKNVFGRGKYCKLNYDNRVLPNLYYYINILCTYSINKTTQNFYFDTYLNTQNPMRLSSFINFIPIAKLQRRTTDSLQCRSYMRI